MRTKFTIILLFAVLAGSAWGASNRTVEAQSALYKAIDAYERGDYGAAKISLSIALEAEPNFAEAQMLKGMLLYRDGEEEEAEAVIQRAMEQNPRLPEKMREKLEQQAHAMEANMTEEDFSHFRLQFRGAEHRNQAWQSVKYLDDAYNYLGSRFDMFPPNKVRVIIFTSDEFWDAWQGPMWLGGFFDKRDGIVRVRVDDPPGGEEEMNRRLRHEFTHAFVHQLYPKELPMWFQEGVAQFYAYAQPTNGFWKDSRLEELRKSMKGAPWMDMQAIQDAIQKKNVSPTFIYLAYLESEAMVLHIAKDHGDSWIPHVMKSLREGAPFETAFQTAVGIPPARCMEQLRSAWH